MTHAKKVKTTLYVDRKSRRWVVRDADGKFWILPVVEHPWEHRRPFDLSPATELEPIPHHYKEMLGLPG